MGFVASQHVESSRARDQTHVPCIASSVQLLNSLQPHGLQHARLPCPSPTPGAYSDSCLSHRWCHPTISSSCSLFLLPSIFPSIRVFSNDSVLRIRWPKYWSLASASVPPVNIQDWFRLGLTGGISRKTKVFFTVIFHYICECLYTHHMFFIHLSSWWKWKRRWKGWLKAQHSEN